MTAESPAPISLPASFASGPDTATATATTTSIKISTRAIPICWGLSFQIGRPSSTS